MEREYDIYCDFDLEKHRQTYVNYLEILIEEDGHIVYAVPSHQEKAIELVSRKLGVSRQEVFDLCTEEYYFCFMNWLLIQGGAIAVWADSCLATSVTKKQVAALRKLKMAGLYAGKIPTMVREIHDEDDKR